jgi:hypothetical protein
VASGRELAEAVVTAGGVLTDLAEVAGRLPGLAVHEAEATARILDRLAEETAEAAGLVRAAFAGMVDSESWVCGGCGGQFIGRRPQGDRCGGGMPGGGR